MMWMMVCLGLVACKSIPASEPMEEYEADELRGSIRDMASQTLSQLYQQYPETQSSVQRSAGYGVFSDFGFKFLFLGSATGHGVVINNATRQETFMEMVELQPGYGFGAQQFKIILIFDTEEVVNSFVNSRWEFGYSPAAGAQTSAKAEDRAMAVSVSPGVTLYQISGEGTVVGVSITGAGFRKDDKLN